MFDGILKILGNVRDVPEIGFYGLWIFYKGLRYDNYYYYFLRKKSFIHVIIITEHLESRLLQSVEESPPSNTHHYLKNS